MAKRETRLMCILWKCSPKMLDNVTGTGNTGKAQGRAWAIFTGIARQQEQKKMSLRERKGGQTVRLATTSMIWRAWEYTLQKEQMLHSKTLPPKVPPFSRCFSQFDFFQ